MLDGGAARQGLAQPGHERKDLGAGQQKPACISESYTKSMHMQQIIIILHNLRGGAKGLGWATKRPEPMHGKGAAGSPLSLRTSEVRRVPAAVGEHSQTKQWDNGVDLHTRLFHDVEKRFPSRGKFAEKFSMALKSS